MKHLKLKYMLFHFYYLKEFLPSLVVQSLSRVQLCNPMDCSTPGFLCFTISQSLLKFMTTESVMLSNHLILLPHLLLPSFFPRIRVFSSESALCIRWLFSGIFFFFQHTVLELQYQSFQWIFWVDFFRIDWFDLLEVQWTLKSLLQHHSSKASILRYSVFFMVQLSHLYITTGKTIALT